METTKGCQEYWDQNHSQNTKISPQRLKKKMKNILFVRMTDTITICYSWFHSCS